VPGPTESLFYVSPDDDNTNGCPIPLTNTTAQGVNFFWVLDGTYTVTCTNQLGGSTQTASTTFTVVRPTNINVAFNIGSVSVGIGENGRLRMRFGMGRDRATAGIWFSNSLTMPGGFSNYNIEFVQIITGLQATITTTNTNSAGGVIPHFRQTNGPVLDMYYPSFPVNMNPVSDSPSLPLQIPTEIGGFFSMTAQTTALFQPLDADSKRYSKMTDDWVPIYTITWNCTGTATGYGLSATNWVLSGTNIWVSSYGDSGTNSPSWTNNIKNCKLMNLKSIVVSIYVIVITANQDLAQTNGPAQLTEWGMSVQGVQLSISITNSVIKAGEQMCIETIITNSATNAIDLSMTGRDTDFDLFLTNGAGRGYSLTSSDYMAGSTFYYTINKTNKFAEKIPLTVGTNVEAGDYTLLAYRRFTLGDGHFRLESNPIKLQVKGSILEK
jgi:hypothetical protein